MNLEAQLELLATDVQMPVSPDFVSVISAGLVAPPAPVYVRRRLLLVAAVIALIVAAALAIPQSRTTIAGWLDFGGIRLEIVDRIIDRDDASLVEIDSSLLLGDESSLGGAVDAVNYPLMQLPDETPDRVFVRQQENNAMVSMLYPATDDLPEIGDTGVGALLIQIENRSDFDFLVKHAPPDGGYEFVSMDNGIEGFWVISGNLSAIPYDPRDTFGLDKVSRPTGNVLLWNENGVTFRLETALARREAIALAERIVPIDEPSGNQSGMPHVWMSNRPQG